MDTGGLISCFFRGQLSKKVTEAVRNEKFQALFKLKGPDEYHTENIFYIRIQI